MCFQPSQVVITRDECLAFGLLVAPPLELQLRKSPAFQSRLSRDAAELRVRLEDVALSPGETSASVCCILRVPFWVGLFLRVPVLFFGFFENCFLACC